MNYNKIEVLKERALFKNKPKGYKVKTIKKLREAKKNNDREYWACDFECTTLEPFEVYLATVENIDTYEKKTFYNIDDFLDFFSTKYLATLWFHNGSKYDNYFIIAKALKEKISFSDQKGLRLRFELPYVDVDLRSGRAKLDKKTGKEVPIRSDIHIVDTRLILQGSIEKLAESIVDSKTGKALSKGTDDKVETPLVGYINNDNDWCETDRMILTKPLARYTRMTDIENAEGPIKKELEETSLEDYIANTAIIKKHSDSFKQALIDNKWVEYAEMDTHILAELIRAYDLKKDYQKGLITAASRGWSALLEINDEYAEHFKALRKRYNDNKGLKRLLATTREAYKGGIAWTNPLYANKLITCDVGYYLDYTSMYPSIYINSDKYPLPTIEPLPEGEKSDLFIVQIKDLHAVVKDNKFPLLKKRTDAKDKTLEASYYKKTFKGDIMITSVEYEYMLENYDIISCGEVITTYYGRNYQLENALRSFGKKYYPLKKNAKTKAIRESSKLLLNAVYGYLGFYDSPRTNYYYELEADKLVKKLVTDDLGNKKIAITGLPVAELTAAAFITAYARTKLAKDINAVGIEHVICCDTDSLICFGLTLDELNQRVELEDPNEPDMFKNLGKFKVEDIGTEGNIFNKAISIKAKTYALADNNGNVVKQATAGANHKFKQIENFYSGSDMLATQTELGEGGCGIRTTLIQLGDAVDPDNVA